MGHELLRGIDMSYVTDYMRTELKTHRLVQLLDGAMPLYRMGRADTGTYVMYIAAFANRLCLAGDVRLGANDQGLVSAPGYTVAWFKGSLSEGYLCEKFLRQEWQWDSAVEAIQSYIESEAADGGGWWSEHTDALREFIAAPDWNYDTPNAMEFYERMISLGHTGDELPGQDYPRIQAGWLCAIQQRFRELASGR